MIIKRKFDKIENNCLKKILYINLIIAVGLAISLYILIGKQINITQIINENLIPFTDFTDVLKLAAGKLNPNATGNYFPFTYIFMRVLEFISFGNYILLYSIIFISCILICGWFCVVSFLFRLFSVLFHSLLSQVICVAFKAKSFCL